MYFVPQIGRFFYFFNGGTELSQDLRVTGPKAKHLLKVGNPWTSVLSCRLGFRLRRWVSSSHKSLVLCEQVTAAGGLRISRHHVPLRYDGYGQSARFSVDFFHIRNKMQWTERCDIGPLLKYTSKCV